MLYPRHPIHPSRGPISPRNLRVPTGTCLFQHKSSPLVQSLDPPSTVIRTRRGGSPVPVPTYFWPVRPDRDPTSLQVWTEVVKDRSGSSEQILPSPPCLSSFREDDEGRDGERVIMFDTPNPFRAERNRTTNKNQEDK